MRDNDAIKQGARRFTLRGRGIWRFFIACDLDEGILRYWPDAADTSLSRMLYSENKDERAVAKAALDASNENAYCIGVKISEAQRSRMEELLGPERIASMRGIDEHAMSKRSGSFCYRDGWMLDFYAEGDDGQPPLEITDIVSLSFDNDMLPFEELEGYVLNEVANDRDGAFLYSVAHKVPIDKTREIIRRALEVGIDAVDEILWYGNGRILRELDQTAIGRHLSYTSSDDSFTVRFGNMTSRFCKLSDRPNCESVFGRDHVFER